MPASDRPSRALLGLATWALPAVVLATSGVAKLIAPGGTPPRLLLSLWGGNGYPLLMRLLGAVELATAAALIVPRARRAGRLAAFGLLAAFSLFAALNAQDTAFVQNCGCLGALDAAVGVGHGLVPMLLRNACLLVLVCLGWGLEEDPPLSWRAAGERAVGLVGLLLLGSLYIGERALHADARGRLTAGSVGQQRSAAEGWMLPDLALRTDSGEVVGAQRWLQGGDRVLFLTTSCPHCERAAPHWARWAERLAAAGQRLLLIAVDESGGPFPAFLDRHGLAHLPHAVLEHPLDFSALGLVGVPALVVVNADLRVTLHEEIAPGPSLLEPLTRLASVLPESASAVLGELARRLLGPEAHVGLPQPAQDHVLGWAVTVDQAPGAYLLAAHTAGYPSHGLELAFAVDAQGRLAGAQVTALAPLLQELAPDLDAELEALRGRPLDQAAEHARSAAQSGGLSAPAWRAVGQMLEAGRQALPRWSAQGR